MKVRAIPAGKDRGQWWPRAGGNSVLYRCWVCAYPQFIRNDKVGKGGLVIKRSRCARPSCRSVDRLMLIGWGLPRELLLTKGDKPTEVKS